jgi:peptidoglycan/LPS O-acetylase OafA/YrhL
MAPRVGPGTPDNTGGFHLGYRPWLDGMRGLAILAVFIYHLQLIAGGFVGVDLFFVLSGFLITSLLLEEWQQRGTISFGRFYLRRALRLLPGLLALLIGCGAYVAVFQRDDAAAFGKEALVAVCYVANWPTLHNVPLPRLGHAWSLSLEEQFYLLWPVLLYLMLRLRLRRGTIMTLVVAGILASAVLRGVLFELYARPRQGHPGSLLRIYNGLDTRADALLVGCLVALLAAWGLLPRSPAFRWATGVASLAGLPLIGNIMWAKHMGTPQLYYGLFTLIAVAFALPAARLLTGPSRAAFAVLEARPLVYLGRISYALYLVHAPIIIWFGWERLGWRHPVETLLVAGASLAAAVLLHHTIERPFLRLKHRFQVVGAVRATSGTLRPRRAAARAA